MPDVPLAHFDQGNVHAFPLVLLHGFSLDHRMWREQVGAHPGVRVIAPDFRGFGASPLGDPDLPRGPEGIERYARDVLALLDRLDVDRFLLGGWSLGGDVAFTLQRLAPERVSGLLLVNAQAESDAPEWRKRHARSIARIRDGGIGALEDELLDAYFTPETRASRPLLEARVREWVRDTDDDAAVHALEALRHQPDDVHRLPDIRVPALIVTGDRDSFTPLESSREMEEGLPRARLHVVERSAHLTPLEAPAEVNAVLCAWLDDVLPRAGLADAPAPG